MNQTLLTPSGLKPQCIHPMLWRANSLAATARQTVSTGYPALNALLPGQGWPLGNVIEIVAAQAGTVELSLIRLALTQLPAHQPIALVNPPLEPLAQCLRNWHLGEHRWLWLTPGSTQNALWASEQLLKHNICSALVCWVPWASATAIRRLHLAAQRSSTLCLLARPASARQHHSPAHFRLFAAPCPQGIELQVLKRPGPAAENMLVLPVFSQPHVLPPQHHHGPVHQPLSATHAFSARLAQRNPATSGPAHAGIHA